MHAIIETKHLRKVFGSGSSQVVAVDDIDLTVHAGEIFGLLGPNGAGKTTTMRMLTTLTKPTSGIAKIAGYKVTEQEQLVRSHLGFVSQTGGLERSATGRENLQLQARIFGMNATQAAARAEELIRALRLESFADRLVETYSGGQRRRTDIALGMVNRPKILFLDEPTIALDPESRAHVWQEIRNLRERGTTIVFSTHYLDEADNLCDRVAIVDHGKIVALDTPQALKRAIASDVIILGVDSSKVQSVDTQALFGSLAGVREIIKEKDSIRFLVHHGEALLPQLLRLCDQAGLVLSTISLYRPTLDDVFLKKTGRSFKQDNA